SGGSGLGSSVPGSCAEAMPLAISMINSGNDSHLGGMRPPRTMQSRPPGLWHTSGPRPQPLTKPRERCADSQAGERLVDELLNDLGNYETSPRSAAIAWGR